MEQWDVVVLGSGAAGLTAAWHARAEGARVLVLNKGAVGRTGATITSGGGVSVAGTTLAQLGLASDPGDTEDDFLADTIRSGHFLSDQALVQSMVQGVGEELGRLMKTGVKITVTKKAPGHSSGRGVRIAGPDMQRTVTNAAVQAGVMFREDFQSTALLLNDGETVGVGGLDRRTGQVEAVHARAVVIATGGTTSNWNLRTSPEELTGDGHAMALAAGAELIDMEMMQFLPCCLVAPEIWRGLQFPWILGPQSGIRAWLLNRYGERFMTRWDPERMELATRDAVAAASALEVAEGRGSPNGGVYLSWAHLPRDIVDNFPTWSPSFSADWRWEGFDMSPLIARIQAGQAIEVAPAAHFSLGGIRIDIAGQTGVPGLFACGEATGGLHGGNRLSGNAGAQILVQGKAAGRSAAAHAKTNSAGGTPQNWPEIRDAIEAPFARGAGIAPTEIRDRLARMAETVIGPVRDGESLTQALDELRGIARNVLPKLACRARERTWNRDWSEALECTAAVPVLEAALIGAINRDRSIGAHLRRDDPIKTKPTPHHSLIRMTDGALTHRSEAVAFPLLAPAA